MLRINCETLLFFKIQHNKRVNCKVNKAAAYWKSNKSICRHRRCLLSATKIHGNETKPLILHYHTVRKCKQQQIHNSHSTDMQSENLKKGLNFCAQFEAYTANKCMKTLSSNQLFAKQCAQNQLWRALLLKLTHYGMPVRQRSHSARLNAYNALQSSSLTFMMGHRMSQKQ